MKLKLAVLVFCLSAAAETAEIELVTGDGYPPFAARDLPDGGLAAAIVIRVFEELGHEVKLDVKPWKRGYADARKKKYLGTFPYGKNAAREALFHYSTPLYEFSQYFFAREDATTVFERDEDLQGLKVCVPIGYNLVRLQQMADKGIVSLERPLDLEACFKMLARGRVDLVRVDELVGWAVIETTFGSRDGFRVLPKPVRKTVEHLIVCKAYPGGREMLDAFDLALDKLRRQGVVDELTRRYLKQ